jgi:hypothetical protein
VFFHWQILFRWHLLGTINKTSQTMKSQFLNKSLLAALLLAATPIAVAVKAQQRTGTVE